MAHHATEGKMQNSGTPYLHSSTPLLTILYSLTVQNTITCLTETMFTGGHKNQFCFP
jgi:hypothetical protein